MTELGALTEPGLVAQEVARVLQVGERPGEPPLQVLARALAGRRLLLVLDNCEHLLGACATLAETLLRAAPGCASWPPAAGRWACPARWPLPCRRWRCPRPRRRPTRRRTPGCPARGAGRGAGWGASSQRAGRGRGGGRDDPGPGADLEALAGHDAVRLFVERASCVRPGFALTAQNAAGVVQICRRLDGLPLALELAAACLSSLSPQQLADRLDDRFRLLRGGNRAAPARHQALRTLVDWSYDLLTPPEQDLFVRLSVFAGSFSIGAAEAVAGEAGVAVPALLGRLVEQSLVVGGAGPAGGGRFRLLETLRRYALERLNERAGSPVPGAEEPAATARRRHAAHFLAVAEEATRHLHGPQQARWLERLDVEHDDLRQALRWALDTGARDTGLRLAGALWWYWATRGRFGEGQRWLEAVLANEGAASRGSAGSAGSGPPTAPVLEAAALRGLGHLAAARGDYGPARTALERALALSQDDGDEGGAAAALTELGVLARNRGEYGVATALHDRALGAMRRLGDSRGVAVSLGHLGGLARARGDYDAAWAHHEASLGGWRSLGDRWGTAYALDHLGVLARDRGDLARAAGLHEEALAIRRALGDRAGLAGTLNNLGAVARGRGDFPRAEALVAEALAIRRALGDRAGQATSLSALATLFGDRGDLARAGGLHEEALAIRRALGDRRGVAIVLNDLGALARRAGDLVRAAGLHEEALAIRRALGDRWGIAYSLDHLAALERDRGDLPRAAELYGESLRLFWAFGNAGAAAVAWRGWPESSATTAP